ncbi:Diphthamide synthesis DPH1/DPH2 [Dillenia turbinata]|uniref:2-(3-amino-3-carboxypropyl)histidine synthase subunit 2 n=1 Tax=Dillenia turbinata TaxID=194707 RepID=A0AAN8ZJN4_9MAGN
MDFEAKYEISRAADFICTRNFTKVALQFPDELLKDSVRVVKVLRNKIRSIKGESDVGLYVMADTTYGSCCVDEVGASHIGADCVIHYGHTCLSPTSTLPAFLVFGKASVSVFDCAGNLYKSVLDKGKPVLVLFGLEYAYAIQSLQETLAAKSSTLSNSPSEQQIQFADVMNPVLNPSDYKTSNEHLGPSGTYTHGRSDGMTTGMQYSIGGLTWNLAEGCKMEDYMLFWIGSDNSAFANAVLTFNDCEIVRYDATENRLLSDTSNQRRILKRRYYLVEKAKDANIVGILVGTLGVAGYLHMIHQMKELITKVGKKAYTFVMGRPNPAKLANFPECDVFIYVSCAQTALLDSKEFLAPVITPFEAMLAFNSGSQWTGTYVMEFRNLISSSPVEPGKLSEEARFSFLKGGYVEDVDIQVAENGENNTGRALALADATEKALQLRDKYPNTLVNGTAKSGAEYLASRSYHGLDMYSIDSTAEPFFIGRSGKASGYKDESENRTS